MSAHVSQPSFQYIGILNGVTYRIDPSSGVMFKQIVELDRSDLPSFTSDKAAKSLSPDVAAALTAASPDVTPVAVTAAEEVPERVAKLSTLFPRSGGEPLRAGHPDLWALLVAGTCLEGTEFSAL